MAVRPLVINFGQSNSGPYHDIASWLPDRVDLNLLVTSNRTAGAYAPRFTLPFNAPGFTGSISLKGQAIQNIRYLSFYNPIVTGYTSYPGTGRVANLVGLTASWVHDSQHFYVEQQFVRGAWRVRHVQRKATGKRHFVQAVMEPVMTFTTSGTQDLVIPGHGFKPQTGNAFDDRVTLTTTGTLPTGLLIGTTYFIIYINGDTIRLSLTAGGSAVSFTAASGSGTHSVNVVLPSVPTGSRLKIHPIRATARQLTGVASTSTVVDFTKVAHGLSELEPVLLSGVLPPEFLPGVPYYATNTTANTFQLAREPDTVPITPSTSGSAIVVDVQDSAGLVELPSPQFDEEFTFAITAVEAETSEAEAKFNVNFGVRRANPQLVGLQLRHVSSAAVRVIDTFTPATRKVTLVNKVGLTAQTWSIAAGDELVIEPQTGVPFEKFCYFLPWTMFEGQESLAVIGKVNPYMPGFDYPTDFHVPGYYGTDDLSPQAIPGTAGLFLRTHDPFALFISWHVGFLARMSEFLGGPVYCVSTDFGGSSATHTEPEIGTPVCGWYDKAQQNNWSIGQDNNCFARWLDELDAAIAAAALEGDTLEVVGVWRNQGFADATSYSDPTYGSSAAQSGAPADKFYEANRAFRAKCRQALKDRGLWPRDAKEIPWIQPLEQQEAADLAVIGDAELLRKVNTAIQRLADEDPYADTWDQTGLEVGPDGIHFLGSELAQVEEENFNAYFRILRSNDPQGEVDICNTALTHIGEAAVVTSIAPPDGSAQAQHCALYYPIARNCVLEAHAWSFATKRRPLQLVEENNTTAWAYAYIRPADALRVLSIVPAGASDDYSVPVPPVQDFRFGVPYPYVNTSINSAVVPVRYAQGVLGDGTPVIYTNEPNAEIRYTALMRDVRAFSEEARLAISWYLASLLAGVTAKGAPGVALQQRCAQMAQAYVTRAVRNDGNQQKVEPDHTASWLQARS